MKNSVFTLMLLMIYSSAYAEEAMIQGGEEEQLLKLSVGGRVFVDSAWYGDANGIDLGDGSEVRNVRLNFGAAYRESLKLDLQVDYAGAVVSLKDVSLSYAFNDAVSIKLGNFEEPIGMESLASPSNYTFMETAIQNAFNPGRRIGLGLKAVGENWTLETGGFDRKLTKHGVKDSSFDLGGRFTIAPLFDAEHLFHLGAAAIYSWPDKSNSLSYSRQPESHITNARPVSTGSIANIDNYLTAGAEIAAATGPISMQGEYTHVTVRRLGLVDLHLQSFYIYTAWTITGEARKYLINKGKFGGITPNSNLGEGGWGAVELAARFSHLDLESRDIAGGVEDNMTLALNWYINPHARIMANYIRANVDRSPLSPTAGLSFNIYQLRMQLTF